VKNATKLNMIFILEIVTPGEKSMSWLLNSILPSKPITPCKAELRPATAEEIKEHTKPRSWMTFIDKVINTVCAPIFIGYSTIYSFVTKQSPDLGFVPASVNIYMTKNPHVIKEILLHHRNDSNDGVFSHAVVVKAMTQMMHKIYPNITSKDMVLTCGPEPTKIYRQFLNQFFTPKSIQRHLNDIKDIVVDFSHTWNKSAKPIVLNQEIKLLATAIMAQIFLGYSEPFDKISAASSHIILWMADNSLFTISRVYKWAVTCFPNMALISSSTKEQTIKTFHEAIEKSIKQASMPETKPSLVKEMLESNFTTEQIQAMIFTLFVAGQDNVSTSLSHVLLKLAQSKELQEKLRQDTSEPMQSPLIRALLCESLRVLCPVAGIGRTVAKPTLMTLSNPENDNMISQTLISEGDQLSAMMKFTAQDPSIYPHPEKFDINRHINQNSFLPNLPHAPFGHGTHLCPGWYLYYAISAIAISHLVHNFEISTTFKGEPRTKIRFVTQLADTITISLHPHSN
jgi:cytochrome P450